MTGEVVPFEFQDHQVRVVMIDDKPWWVVIDVCAVLGIKRAPEVVRRLDEEYTVLNRVFDARGVERETWLVNEPGLYELIFRSDKPEAATFRRWVFSEVLPQIRRAGSYGNAHVEPPQLTELEMLLVQVKRAVELERVAKENHERINGHDLKIAQHDERISNIEHIVPLTDGTGLMSVREAAQLLGTGLVRFYRWLDKAGITFPDTQQGGHKIYQKYHDAGWGVAKLEPWPNGRKGPNGRPGHAHVVYFTGKGIAELRRRFDGGASAA